MLTYPVSLTPDDNDTILVTFPDVPEATTFGDDKEEALTRAVDALETALTFYIDARKPLPKPSPLKGRPGVSPCPLSLIKLELYKAMIDSNVRKAELSRRLGVHLPQIDRLLDLNHASRLDLLERALSILGRRLCIEVKAA